MVLVTCNLDRVSCTLHTRNSLVAASRRLTRRRQQTAAPATVLCRMRRIARPAPVFAIRGACMPAMPCVRLDDYRHKTEPSSSLVLTIALPLPFDMLRSDICTRPNAPSRCGHAVDHVESRYHPPIVSSVRRPLGSVCGRHLWYSRHVHCSVRLHGQTSSKHGLSPHALSRTHTHTHTLYPSCHIAIASRSVSSSSGPLWGPNKYVYYYATIIHRC